MIVFKGRDKNNVVIFEKDGLPMELPKAFTISPSRQLRRNIYRRSFTAALLHHWGFKPLKKLTVPIAEKWFGDSSGRVLAGYTITPEREEEMKEQAVAIMVAEKLKGEKQDVPF
jgi:hypothetical protein